MGDERTKTIIILTNGIKNVGMEHNLHNFKDEMLLLVTLQTPTRLLSVMKLNQLITSFTWRSSGLNPRQATPASCAPGFGMYIVGNSTSVIADHIVWVCGTDITRESALMSSSLS